MTSSTNQPKPPSRGRTSRPLSSSTRRAHDPEARFTRNVTIAFVVIVVAVVLAVVIGLAYGYWETNLKPLANVDGTQIGRGEWQDREKLESFRADRMETTTRAALLAGQIDEDLANARLTAAANARNAGAAGAMESLVDLRFKAQLAQERGITLSDEELAEAIAADGTLPEERRIGAILVQPVGWDAGQASAEDIAAAKATAEEALAALRSGSPLAEVAAEYSPATAAADGDLGYLTLDAARGIDPVWGEQLFALEEGGIGDVMETQYGKLIGVVSAIAPETPDEGFAAAVDAQVGAEVHRRNVEMEALAAKLEDQVNADAVARDYEQVRLAEIVVAGNTLIPPEEQQPTIRASHILYAPEPGASPSPSASPSPGDPSAPAAAPSPPASARAISAASAAPVQSVAPSAAASAAPASASPAPSASPDPNASPTPIPADDPSWDVAQAEAEAAAAALRAIAAVTDREESFAERARAESDDETSGSRGGDLGFFERSQMVPEFADAVFDAQDPQPGDIIGPVRSQFGWHVILFEEARATLSERLAAVQDALAAEGSDFATVARERSDGPTAAEGGEIGWTVLEDLDEVQQLALTAIDVGERTEPIDEQRGYAIYQKEEEATRPLEPDVAAVKAVSAFDQWYEEQRLEAEDAGRISVDDSVYATEGGA
jgi:parvulin-like peptidyl-prolyl isomerase